MRAIAGAPPSDGYILARDATEYERLRGQARIWEPATRRLFDCVELGPGVRCLDAGCGPGEVMRLMAERVGPSGEVTGVDIDAEIGEQALAELVAAGHPQCSFAEVDLESGEAIPGEPFDFVYSRLVLFHAHDQVAMVRRLWDAVAPGGCLVLHDYDLRAVDVTPRLDSIDEWKRVVLSAFTEGGRDIHAGQRLPLLLQQAGLGACDGTEVAGRLDSLGRDGWMFADVYRGILPAAIRLGLTTQDGYDLWSAGFARDLDDHRDHAVVWPLLIGAWKHKPPAG
jgi:SAM-dependent methyltransferase